LPRGVFNEPARRATKTPPYKAVPATWSGTAISLPALGKAPPHHPRRPLWQRSVFHALAHLTFAYFKIRWGPLRARFAVFLRYPWHFDTSTLFQQDSRTRVPAQNRLQLSRAPFLSHSQIPTDRTLFFPPPRPSPPWRTRALLDTPLPHARFLSPDLVANTCSFRPLLPFQYRGPGRDTPRHPGVCGRRLSFVPKREVLPYGYTKNLPPPMGRNSPG